MDAIGKDYLDRAAISIKQAEGCLKQGDQATCVLRSAEAIEFSLKAAIRLVGKTHERKHDVSGTLVKILQDFPLWFQVLVPRLALLSRTLTSLSIPAKYGDEMLSAPPTILFSQSEGRAYLESASEVLNDCLRLARERKKEGAESYSQQAKI